MAKGDRDVATRLRPAGYVAAKKEFLDKLPKDAFNVLNILKINTINL
jgi:hypothetical protein